MRDYRRLEVWERAHGVTLRVYELTEGFPRTEQWGLVGQMRRAAASIPTNVAEGAGSATERDFARFISYSIASSVELEYQVRLAGDLGFLSAHDRQWLDAELGTIRGMLTNLRSRLG